MGIVQAILMGIVQGLTEYLPVSSSAHLRLTPVLFGFSDPGAAFTAVIQLGTVLAVLIYFRNDLWKALTGWIKGLTNPAERNSVDSRMGWAVLIGSIPVILVAFPLKKYIEGDTFRSLWVVAGAMVGMGLIMYAAEVYGAKNRPAESVQPMDGLIPGILQCLALIPGMSRSGSTITGAFLVGFDRSAAVRLSFLMSVPAVAGAGFYEFFKERKHLGAIGMGPTLIATVVSFIVGYACIAWLISWISKNGVKVFVIYRLVLGGILIALLASGKLNPMAGEDTSAKTAVTASR